MHHFALLTLAVLTAQTSPRPIVSPNALLTTPISGLDRTNGNFRIVGVTGQPFTKALRVFIGQDSAETNATQLQLRNTEPVQQGDVLMATFFLRGTARTGSPARVEYLFEKAVDPWTKSVTQPAVALGSPGSWRKVLVPFQSAQTYAPGEAMASIRLAFGPQVVELGGLSILNYGKSRTLDQLAALALTQNTLGRTLVKINLANTKQRIRGLGGNFAQPRYGATEPMDAVGRYVLGRLNVVHARIGLPLNWWNPEPGVFRDDAQARASLVALQEFARRKIPTVASVWEGPEWMLGQGRERSRTLPRDKYDECIDAVARYLVLARDKYGCHVDFFSFNEPDYGVNFKFSPKEMADFVRMAVPEFARRGLKTKFLTADTANGTNFYDYAKPLLEDKTIAPYLGPLAFHSWDALNASEVSYRRIAELGRKYKKEVWCLEAGHDAQLWQRPNPWDSWENGLKTAQAYARTVRLTESSLMDYWTYQDNYPLVDKASLRPFPVFKVMRQIEAVLVPGSRMAETRSANDDLQTLATVGPRSGDYALLLVNPAGAGRAILTGLPPRSRVRIFLSDKDAQEKPIGSHTVGSQGVLEVGMPIRSVVTIQGTRGK